MTDFSFCTNGIHKNYSKNFHNNDQIETFEMFARNVNYTFIEDQPLLKMQINIYSGYPNKNYTIINYIKRLQNFSPPPRSHMLFPKGTFVKSSKSFLRKFYFKDNQQKNKYNCKEPIKQCELPMVSTNQDSLIPDRDMQECKRTVEQGQVVRYS